MTLLPWLQLHLTKHSNQGNALHTSKCAARVVAQIIEEFPRTMLVSDLKSCIGGATTREHSLSAPHS